MKPSIFLYINVFSLTAMDTPPIAIRRASSPATQRKIWTQHLITRYEKAAAYSPPKAKSLLQQLNCPKKVIANLNKDLAEIEIKLKSKPGKEEVERLVQEQVNIHFTIMKLKQTTSFEN